MTTDEDFDNQPQSAMMLTEEEWSDLAEMVSLYEKQSRWAEHAHAPHALYIREVIRKRTLAKRIIEAA